MMIRRKFSVLIIFFYFIGNLFATTYYMRAIDGNNTNNGTSWNTAWKTVRHMDTMITAGDSVIFGAGRYLESMINPPLNEDFANRTVYIDSSYLNGGAPHQAQINGGYDVPTWVEYDLTGGKNIWMAKFDPAVECWYTQLLNNRLHTLVQDDSLLFIPLDLNEDENDVDIEGEMWHSSANDSIYAWIYNNEDPNDIELLMPCVKTVMFIGDLAYGGSNSEQSHTLFKGLDIRVGDNTLISIKNESDSMIFEHCKMGFVGGSENNNPAIILSDAHYTSDPDSWTEYLTVRSCSLHNVMGVGTGRTHGGAGIGGYTLREALIESTHFAPTVQSNAIDWKMGTYNSYGEYSENSIIRYNVIEPELGPGIWFSKKCKDNLVYGNIFKNINGIGIQIKAYAGDASNTQNCVRGGNEITNNTFYNCDNWFVVNPYNWIDGDDNIVKYNVFYDIQTISEVADNRCNFHFSEFGGPEVPTSETYYTVDFNIWYDPGYVFSSHIEAVDEDLDGWTTYGFSPNSDTSDPGLTDPANGDFSRPFSSPEMNLTYGGKTWTLYGAWQPDDGGCPPPASPELAGPPNGATDLSQPIILSWNSVSGVTQYRAQVDINSLFSSPVADVQTSALNTNVSDLNEGTTYYWRARSFDTCGWGGWSNIWSFTTECLTLPGTPILVSPSDGAADLPQPVTFTWQAASNADDYQLQLDDTSAFNSPDIDIQTGSLSYSASGLIEQTVLYWRVRGLNACSSGNWSAVRSFSAEEDTSTSENIALLDPLAEVSGTFSGYSPTAINDAILNPYGGTATTWASDESSISPHWVEIDFGENKMASRVCMFWAWNGFQSNWTTSQQYYIQSWNGSNYEDVLVVNNSQADSMVVTDFQPVNTSRMRLFQPANMGPSTYPTIMWLAELEIYGTDAVEDSISPGTIFDLNAIPGDNHGEINLEWTAIGDDGASGIADHYVIKYSNNLVTEANWNNAATAPNPPQPAASGSNESFVIEGLEEGQIYYVAMKTYDDAGNASALSNCVDTFASGIMMPIQIETYIDSLSSLVTVSCELVESYKSIDYLFALDSVSAFPDPEFVIDSLGNDVAMAVFEGLSDDAYYYWRCCAISTDYTDSSAWTPSIEFNLHFGLISSLAESDCLYPAEGEIVPSNRPYFIVRNPQNIYELYFQVDDNDDFSSPVESGSVPPAPGDETRWQLPATDPLEQGITYYWRVSDNNAVWTSLISFSALLEIHPYPNPFRASEGHTNITFTNLPQDSSIMFSTISGDIILREDNIGPGDWMWTVKNDRGNSLAPGVYLYTINFPSGSSNGKILVIR